MSRIEQQPLQRTLCLVLPLLLVVSCTSTSNESAASAKDFKVAESVLSEPARMPQGQVEVLADDSGRQPPQTHIEQVPSLGRLPSGSPLLSEAPQFDDSELVQVSVDEMPLPDFVHYVFGELLSLDYVLSPDVERMRDPVSLRVDNELARSELFGLVRGVLEQRKVSIYTKDRIVYLGLAEGQANSQRNVGIGARIEDLPQYGDNIIQLIPFTFNSSRTISNVVSKLSTAQIYVDPEQKLLVAEGRREDIERVIRLVEMLDVPSAKGRDIRMVSLGYVSPDELINQLKELMMAEGTILGDDVALVPISRLNALVIYAVDRQLGDRVESWITRLDAPTGGDRERFYVFRPQFTKAKDLGASLTGITGGSQSGSGADKDKEKDAPKSGPGEAVGFDGVKINVDETQNALVIKATPSKYQELMALLKQLDRLPGQIALQVVIAEVKLTDNVSTGVDWFYDSSKNYDGMATADFKASSGTFSFAFFKGDWRGTLNMLAAQTDVRVLSQPYLLVRDGQTANINSGDQVPIITQTSSTDDNPDTTRNEVQYRSTGISVSVTPTINSEGIVSLEIAQETSKANPTDGFEVATPTITTRNLSTQVLAADGQTVVLGGLIQDSWDDKNNKVPLFGDIPGIGKLFQQNGESSERTELMMLVTTRIIRDTTDLAEFGDRLKELYSFPVALDGGAVAQPSASVEPLAPSQDDLLAPETDPIMLPAL